MSYKLIADPIIKGKLEKIKNRSNEVYEKYKVMPTLLLIRVGNRNEDIAYERVIINNCKKTNIHSQTLILDGSITMDDFEKVIMDANNNEDVHGIIVFRPLPQHLDSKKISLLIDSKKDVDCMSYENVEKIFTNRDVIFSPCTAKATIELLEYYRIPIKGKRVCVVGTSMVVGKPLAMMFLDRFATVTMCHIYTENLKEITKQSDIVVVAIGKAKFFDKSYFNENAVVVDIGVSFDSDNNICGDVDFVDVCDSVKAISPRANGVGNITTAILLNQIITACELQSKAI